MYVPLRVRRSSRPWLRLFPAVMAVLAVMALALAPPSHAAEGEAPDLRASTSTSGVEKSCQDGSAEGMTGHTPVSGCQGAINALVAIDCTVDPDDYPQGSQDTLYYSCPIPCRDTANTTQSQSEASNITGWSYPLRDADAVGGENVVVFLELNVVGIAEREGDTVTRVNDFGDLYAKVVENTPNHCPTAEDPAVQGASMQMTLEHDIIDARSYTKDAFSSSGELQIKVDAGAQGIITLDHIVGTLEVWHKGRLFKLRVEDFQEFDWGLPT